MSKNFTALADLPLSTVHALIDRADSFSHQNFNSLPRFEDKIVINVFYEPSTRTRMSFEMAAKRLKAQVINFDISNSSVKKGETLYDTLRTLESQRPDALILRHSDDRVFETLSNIKIPLINAGAGKHEHPSQGLLDLLTIRQEFGRFEGLHVVIIGDCKHSRVAGTHMLMAEKLGIKITVCGPEEMIPANLPTNCKAGGLNEALATADVVIGLRNQFERHENVLMTLDTYRDQWCLTAERAARMKKSAIIMNPGPFNRNLEIVDELVEAPQSRIFKQVENGVYARMSILEWIFKGGSL